MRSRPLLWVFVVSLGWLVLISGSHYLLNRQADRSHVVVMGYMPVITNLACPLLDAASHRRPGTVRFEALKFSSFAEMAEALRNRHIDAAFIIAPLAIVLRLQGEDVRVVYIGNRHESTLVVRSDIEAHDFADLAGHSLAVPMRFSGHNLCALQLAEENGLGRGGVHIVEMNPPDMASALATGALDAYFVGEPFAVQTTRTGTGRVLLYVEQVWPGFICNLLLVRQDFLDEHPDRARLLVQGAVRSGFWARENPEQAAAVAAKYWNQPLDLVTYALTTPAGRVVFDRAVPVQEELEHLAAKMAHFGLANEGSIAGLVEPSLARATSLDHITDLESILDVQPSHEAAEPEGTEEGDSHEQ